MGRKVLLAAHLVASLGWVGALAVFLAHAVASVVSRDEQMVRAASIAMGVTAWFVILPFSLFTLATGLAEAFTSAWGVVRHYWIVFKLLLTLVATAVLILKLAPISHLAAAASGVDFNADSMAGLRTSLLLHAIGGLVVLLAAIILAVYKPAGLAAFAHPPAPMPRWVKGFGMALGMLLVIVLAMVLTGRHGPGAHG